MTPVLGAFLVKWMCYAGAAGGPGSYKVRQKPRRCHQNGHFDVVTNLKNYQKPNIREKGEKLVFATPPLIFGSQNEYQTAPRMSPQEVENRPDSEMCDIEFTLIFTCFGAPRAISLRALGPQGRLLFQAQKSTRFGIRF